MNWLNSNSAMMVLGFVMNGALIAYLTLYHSSPSPLSAAHAQALSDTSIKSCRHCHTDQGLTRGCLTCHREIAEQIDRIQGYHGYLLFEGRRTCQPCHLEHLGEDFPLVSDLAWEGQGFSKFNHPHVHFKFARHHEGLTCAACHRDKLKTPFTLPSFPHQPRTTTYLGLSQDCTYCHASPHRTRWDENCQACHLSTDLTWAQARGHTDVQLHAETGFVLDGIHGNLTCDSCHPSDGPYAQRYPKTDNPDSVRSSDDCQKCHGNPHEGKVQDRYGSCSRCHDPARLVDRWWQVEKIWGK